MHSLYRGNPDLGIEPCCRGNATLSQGIHPFYSRAQFQGLGSLCRGNVRGKPFLKGSDTFNRFALDGFPLPLAKETKPINYMPPPPRYSGSFHMLTRSVVNQMVCLKIKLSPVFIQASLLLSSRFVLILILLSPIESMLLQLYHNYIS